MSKVNRALSYILCMGLVTMMPLFEAQATMHNSNSSSASDSLSAEGKATINAKNANKPSFLFVQTAKEATIKKLADNKYQIILKQPADYVTYFTDRPAKKAGSVPLENFLANWQKQGKNYFKDNAPNAFVHGVYSDANNDKKSLGISLELSKPEYDAVAGTLTYTVKLLEGVSMPSIQETILIEQVSIFVDDGPCEGCW